MALTTEQMRQWAMANKDASDAEIFQWMQQNGITPEQLAPAAGASMANIYGRYNTQLKNAGLQAPSAKDNQIRVWMQQNPKATDADIFTAMQQWGVTPDQFIRATADQQQTTGVTPQDIYSRYNAQATANGLPQVADPGTDPFTGKYVPGGPSGTGYGAKLGPSSTPYGQYLNFGDGFGLSGAESAIKGGAVGGLGALEYAANRVEDTYQSGIEGLSPYMQAGGAANSRIANLTGTNGADAQTIALDEYQQSPWVDQVRKNSERAITRNAAATGNLGSGNTLDQLFQNSAGLFLDDYYKQLDVMQGTADRGQNAATVAGGLYAGLGGNFTSLGSQASAIPVNAGNATGAYRYQAGRDLSTNISDASRGLADYTNKQGAGIADIVGDTTNNIRTLLQSAYGGDATAKQNLMSLLTSLSTQTSGQVSSLPIIPGAQTDYLGQLGTVASGTGGLLEGLKAAGLLS